MNTDHEPLVPKLDTYDDSFVTINGATNTLTLKHFLLVKPTLEVHIPSLIYIRRAKDVVGRIGVKPQGLSLSGILWARDWSRGGAIIGRRSGYEKSFVIKVQGDKFRRGFSVEDPETFLAVLERVRPGVTRTAMAASSDEGGGGAEAQCESAGEREAGTK